MPKKYTGYLIDQITNKTTIRIVLIILSLLILLAQGGILALYVTGGLAKDALIISLGMLPILLASALIYRKKTETGGAIIAISLTVMITILATIGQGIYDIGTMAFPAILIIASLILKRNTVFYLTGLIILCNGWLIFGAVYGLYQPLYPQQSYLRQFIITSIILLVTMAAIYILSNTVHSSLTVAQTELGERQKIELALRERESMYRGLVEQTTVTTYRDSADLDGSALYISPQIENLIGYTPAEWTDSPIFWQSLVHPDDLPKVLGELEEYITTGKRTISEYRLKTKEGRWVWVRDESTVINNDEDGFQFVYGVYIDITEQKTAEHTIKQREEILGAVADTAQLLLKSRDWREEINEILKLLGGATRASHVYIFENYLGRDSVKLSSQRYEWTAPDAIPELDNPVYQNTRLIPDIPGFEDWYANLSTGKPFYGSKKQYPRYWKKVFEERGLKTMLDMPIFVNGDWWGIIGFDDFVNEMPWSQAEIDALVAAAGNLGTAIERHESDKALRVSEEKFQHAFDHTYVSMAISQAADSTLLDVNDAFCKVTGYSRDEAIGKRAGRDLNIWANPEDRNVILNILGERGYVDEYKANFRRKNGEIGTCLLSAINVSIAGKTCQLYTFYDISEIDQLLNELKAKNEELQNFTYTVSHDLKAPLVTISGFMGYLEQDSRKGDMERVTKDILRINDAVTKMQRLLNELLELSRIGRMMNAPESIPFGDIVKDALGVVEGRLDHFNVAVEVADELPIIHGDRVRLVEVIQNLVDNAAKFMGDQPNPKIEIGFKLENNKPTFFLRDNGIGVEPEQQERIFGLFNKLDTNTEGTGIGLALVKRIIEVHGGDIWVESDGLGKGSTFYFTLTDQLKLNKA